MASPQITRIQNEFDQLPFVDVHFPDSGTIWRYTFQGQLDMNRVLRHRLNVGRMVGQIKQLVGLEQVTAVDITHQRRH
jgi:hypothetical protein